MPLVHGKSKKAFEKNVKTEMHHGHPMAQSLAIAYAVKRKAQHHKAQNLAEGGYAGDFEKQSQQFAQDVANLPKEAQASAEQAHKDKVNNPAQYAKGGFIGSHQKPGQPHEDHDFADMNHHKEELASGYMPEHNKHYAHGGHVKGVHKENPYKPGQSEAGSYVAASHEHSGYLGSKSHAKEKAKELHKENLHELKSMKKPHLYAEGGDVEAEHNLAMKKAEGKVPTQQGMGYAHGGHVKHYAHGSGHKKKHEVLPYAYPERETKAYKEDQKSLSAQKAGAAAALAAQLVKKFGAGAGIGAGMLYPSETAQPEQDTPEFGMRYQDSEHKAYGGLAEHHKAHELHGVHEGHQTEAHEKDIVGRIMHKKMHHYSKGGQVANDVGVGFAMKEPAEYDELVKDDDLEFHYTGANSGDNEGDAREDHDRHDIVARIMASKKKKDKMPPGYPGR